MLRVKILIVDDDSISVFLIKKTISKVFTSSEIVSKSNGQEALGYLKNAPKPDLIILDLQMPVMDGFQFLEEINKALNSCSIIVLSNSSREDDKEKAKQLGADAYLIKPLQENDLLDVLNNPDILPDLGSH